ncbi:NAD(P)/FAD-dependent oxidoreductase [Variovorax paradoxus]|uniref:NAD(P)/FAD-dependent oxidoreductase n=1 Tax=Variovorax paradoxus TaxID=34073 RepID=UPI0003A19802|nr:NAD(P)/FAD-dependent oxidoreductase [Variovorax paradoxus]
MNEINVVVIGAGPAGLTAAYELQRAGVQRVCVVEADTQVGGISKTVEYRGNRIDIGGHRFFSKSDWVMQWWASILPVEKAGEGASLSFKYQGQQRDALPENLAEVNPSTRDDVMMVRSRLSRIYFNERFFDYPLKLNAGNLRKLGWAKTVTFGFSYIAAKANPIKQEASLQDFFINRFGEKLYRQFFKEYTEKVWGVPCSEISAAWGAQRVKSLSVSKALWHAAKSALGMNNGQAEQTSLIESFVYPKLGPGQMWEEVAKRFMSNGGVLLMKHRAQHIEISEGVVRSVEVVSHDGQHQRLQCTHVISTMPVKDLVAASKDAWPAEVADIASRLEYRDFMTVGLLYRREDLPVALSDNWIYIQEPGVKVGRVQVFNNWSPYMVSDPDTVWLGLEFFCKEGDDLWSMSDDALKQLAQSEMKQIKLVSASQAIDATVLRVPKAYPGYFGEAYEQFGRVQSALDAIPNLFLVGRNGMHRYNNQDHSMLTAKEAAHQIITGVVDKSRLWAINVDDEYHEEKVVPDDKSIPVEPELVGGTPALGVQS